jgi:hypothetical protein
VHVALLYGLPFYFWGVSALWRCILPCQLVGGFFLASVFAVSHNVPEILYNAPRTSIGTNATHSLPREPVAADGGAVFVASGSVENNVATLPAAKPSQVVRRRGSGASLQRTAPVAPSSKREAAQATSLSPAPPLDWAEAQIRSSANWSVGSTFWLLVSGGLNYQIEHHLFPGIAHVHYPAISAIVRDECSKRGIPYTAYPSFRAIFYAHVLQLYRLGRPPIGAS